MTAVQTKCTAVTAGSEKAKSNPFVIGTKNIKLEAIKDHESSKSHLHTISCKISKTALPEETTAVKALTSTKKIKKNIV